MKKTFLLILLIFLFSSCEFNEPYYKNSNSYNRTRYYDNKSRYQGYSVETSYGRTRYYNKKGKYKGYSVESGSGRTIYYDKKGKRKLVGE